MSSRACQFPDQACDHSAIASRQGRSPAGSRGAHEAEARVIGVGGGRQLAGPFGTMAGELAAVDSQLGDQLSRAP
ncbi:MAG TPA: hypothetical protein VMG38_19585 [Trebonia sp.]|nr:hypothetical protein [Trebonia sp.]